MKVVPLQSRMVGPGHPCFITAEIGSNHNQSLATALEMIRVAAQCGADGVKFQSLNYDEMYAIEDSETRNLYELIKLDHSWYSHLKTCADKAGVIFFSCPCYLYSIEIMENLGVQLYKIASPQTFAFPQLIHATAATGKPLMISTGYCDEKRIRRAVDRCRSAGNDRYILLQCTSQYPVTPENIHFNVMDTFRQRFDCPVGFSDHSTGTHLAVAAVARGANVIEKHFTLDRKQPGPDHFFALEPSEFKDMVDHIRDTEKAMGSDAKQVLPEETDTLKTHNFIYRIVAGRDLQQGEILDETCLRFKRAPAGIPAEDEPAWKNRKLTRAKAENTVIYLQDLL